MRLASKVLNSTWGNEKTRAGKQLYASIEHRVLDSAAFADLKFASRTVLLLMARQYNGSNNGHIQATFSWMNRYGIGSEHTLQKCIAELISHGFVYRTRSHGANKAWARYALTWLPISKDRSGLFMDGYIACAWRNWDEEKNSRQIVQE